MVKRGLQKDEIFFELSVCRVEIQVEKRGNVEGAGQANIAVVASFSAHQ